MYLVCVHVCVVVGVCACVFEKVCMCVLLGLLVQVRVHVLQAGRECRSGGWGSGLEGRSPAVPAPTAPLRGPISVPAGGGPGVGFWQLSPQTEVQVVERESVPPGLVVILHPLDPDWEMLRHLHC